MSDATRQPEPDLRGPRRPDQARHRGPPGARRGHRDRARPAVPDELAWGIQATQGAPARRARRPGPGRPVAALPARTGAAPRRHGLAGAIPPDLGGTSRPARRLPSRAAGRRSGDRRRRMIAMPTMITDRHADPTTHRLEASLAA